MGVVFSWKELAAGRVPESRYFPIALEKIREALQNHPAILAALACGSVVRDDYNRRSDLDVVVVYEADRVGEVTKCLKDLADVVREEWHIRVNFEPCDYEIAQTNMHFFGPAFRQHLIQSMQQGGAIKGSVPRCFAQSVTLEEEIRAYLRRKLYSLESQNVHFDLLAEVEQMHFLEKLLTAPVYVARKILTYHRKLPADDSKYAVLEAYKAFAPGTLGQTLEELMLFDKGYGFELETQLRDLDETRYVDCLAQIWDAAPQIIAFVRANVLLVAQ